MHEIHLCLKITYLRSSSLNFLADTLSPVAWHMNPWKQGVKCESKTPLNGLKYSPQSGVTLANEIHSFMSRVTALKNLFKKKIWLALFYSDHA